MKILCAVYGCEQDALNGMHQLNRDTWGGEFSKIGDLKFFVGHGNLTLKDDEVRLDAPDDKWQIIYKVVEMLKWAVNQEYDLILKIDTDSYINVPEMMKQNYHGFDYIGSPVGEMGSYYSCTNIYSFIQGSSSWLSRRAAEIVIKNAIPVMLELAPKAMRYQGIISPYPHSEDLWVGQALTPHILSHGIKVLTDTGYTNGPLTYHFGRDKQKISVFNWMTKLHQAQPDLNQMNKVHQTERG